ncbi:MAG TPA: hypothetical protein VN844_24940, partial [Pyrinomonadaceae bacterium]|nr:hypothetical protein [Pyrinomonadaceae bacterium]
MLGSRSPVPIAASLTVIIFCLLTAVTAGAQTPVAESDKPAAELNAATPKTAANPAVATPTNSNVATTVAEETVAKPATASPKVETESVKPETVNATTQARPAAVQACKRTVKADVVAIPQPIMLNRLGATIPNAFIFALRDDTTGTGNNITLRDGKRPRPIVLRANVNDCLEITFTNAIPQAAFDSTTPNSPAVGTKETSLFIQGQEWTTSSQDDASFVGKNSSALASAGPPPSPTPSPMPPQTQVYKLFIKNEGTFLLYTMGDATAEPTGQISRGLFGALNVQPESAEWYRSQVTKQELDWATTGVTANKQPIIN